MQRVALVLGVAALAAVTLAAPGPLFAIGLGIAAIGTGWVGYRRRTAPGLARLTGAAAITVGAIGLALGAARVGLTLAAIDHLAQRL